MKDKIESKGGIINYINSLEYNTVPIKLTRKEFEKAMQGNYEPHVYYFGLKNKELFEKALKDYIDNER